MSKDVARARRGARVGVARLVTLVAVALLALVAAACGGGDEGVATTATTAGTTEGADGKVTLRILAARSDVAVHEAESKKLVKVFERQNPGIVVRREALEGDQLRLVINTRLGGNNAPDLVQYDTGPGFGGVLAKNGLIQPIDDAYEQYGWEVFDWAKARATYGGKVYGVPEQVEELGIYYNKDVLAELGFAEEPRTLEDLTAIADAVKAKNIIPFAFGDQDQWPAGHQFSMVVSNLLGREGLDDILFGDGAWNSPEVVKAIDIVFRQFEEKGYFPKGVVGLSYDDANALFMDGKAAMLPSGTWLVGEITKAVKFEVGFFPFPSIDGSDVAPPAGVGSGWFVPAKAKHRDAALKYVDFLQSSKEATTSQLTVFNLLPARPVDTRGRDLPPLFREVLTDLSKSTDPSSFGYNIDVLTPQSFIEVMFTGFQDVLNGRRSPQEQADALQEAWEKAKEQGDILEKP